MLVDDEVTFVTCHGVSADEEVKVRKKKINVKDVLGDIRPLFADAIVTSLSSTSPILRPQPHYKIFAIVEASRSYTATVSYTVLLSCYVLMLSLQVFQVPEWDLPNEIYTTYVSASTTHDSMPTGIAFCC